MITAINTTTITIIDRHQLQILMDAHETLL